MYFFPRGYSGFFVVTVIVTALILLLFGGPAPAAGFSRSCTYSQFYGSRCVWQTIKDPAPPTAEEIEAKRAEIAKWEAFCKPVRNVGDDGLVRLTYAHKGCEFGRSE